MVVLLQFVDALAALLGNPLEVCMPPKHTTPLRPGTSGGGAGTSSSTSSGGVGPKFGSVAFHVHYDQQPFLLFVELGQRFPEELPVVTLQSVRCVRSGY